ncbi:MAG: DUF4007 family protein [Bacillota bacterium]|nr:DUF4007 family protein [Bacillota bacterium]
MAEEAVKFKLKGHESFFIREGWLAKGIKNVDNNSRVFISDDATDVLGIGTNMVKSLRYWLQACGVTEERRVENNKREQFLTGDLGKIIKKYDPYFEDIFSLWLIHYKLVTNTEFSTAWYLFFNEIKANEFTKDELKDEMVYALNRINNNSEFSQNSLFDDCECIIKTYYSNKKENKNPEDNISCPLTELGLLSKINSYHGEEIIIKRKPSVDKLDKLIVLYIILDNMKNSNAISIESILNNKCNAGRVLNLDRNLLNEYLDELKNLGYIEVNRTAGLNQVYNTKKHTKDDIIKEYYEQLME